MVSCEEKVYCAKLAEKAQRYDEMVNYMKDIAHDKTAPLTGEERNLLSVAFKNAVGSLRSALRIARSAHAKEESHGAKDQQEFARTYCNKIKQQLEDICKTILTLLSDRLIEKDSRLDSRVLYYQMQGDYNRYLAEFAEGDERDKAIQNAQVAYDFAHAALKNSGEDLSLTHPIRLGLALNYSVFQYEDLNRPGDAYKTARTAFEQAIAELDDVSEEDEKESTLTMQHLRENLILWATEQE